VFGISKKGLFMKNNIKHAAKTFGLPPGSLVHVGKKDSGRVKITVIDYNASDINEKALDAPEEAFPFLASPTVTWINIDGIHDTGIIKKIGEHFGLHPLTLEDIVFTNQRAKFESFDNYIYILLKMVYLAGDEDKIHTEQVSLVLGENYVLSFQEKEGDIFDVVRERLRASRGRIRKQGPDYLAYSLLDTVVDNYFLILEHLGERADIIEGSMLGYPGPECLNSIQHMKKDMLYLRKSIWPLREVISSFHKDESRLIKDMTIVYIRDLYDHTIQVIDTVETLRDMASGMLDIYLSSISNRMNEVMKVLTIIATIFIPLTFIAGIYGMNFNTQRSPFNMPELNWPYGYISVWAIMIMVALVMLFYFKRKKWL
jgi:magnesium transporter